MKGPFTRIFQSGLILLLLVLFGSPPVRVMAQTDRAETPPVYLPLVLNNFDPAIQWGSLQTLTLSPSPFDSPQMVIDLQGRLHVFWDVWPWQSAFIYHTYLTEQGWSSPETIAPTLGSSKLLSPPMVGPDGRIHLLWHNALNFGGPYRLMYAAWNEGVWAAEEELLQETVDNNPQGMIRLDRGGVVHATIRYSNILYANIIHRVRTSRGWSDPQTIPTSFNGIDKVWADDQGGVRLYTDTFSNQLNYSYWKNDSFLVRAKLLQGLIGYRSTLLDGADNLHVFKAASAPIPGGSVTGIYHQCLDNSLAWQSEAVISGQSSVSGYQTARDEEAGFALAWNEYQPGQAHLAVWEGCTQAHAVETDLPVLPNSMKWGDIKALAIRHQPGEACLLVSQAYSSGSYGVLCANISR